VRRDLGLGLLEAGEQLAGAGQEDLALHGQRQPAGGAVHQPHAQVRFQIADMARDGRLRHPEGLGTRDEAAGVDHGHEGLQGLVSVHGGNCLE